MKIILLDNTHKVIVTLNPEQGKEEREQEVLAEKMAALKASMDTETIAQNIELCSELHKRQAAADTASAGNDPAVGTQRYQT